MSVRPIILALALLAVAPGAQAAEAGCRITPVADLGKGPARWLGGCPGGQADGLGVIRAGTAEPYRFFAGEAHAGHPGRGLIVTDESWFAADGFDAARQRHDINSGDLDAYHALFVLAAQAARGTAQRFAAAGNRGSAAHYARLAKKIEDGEPE